MPDVVSPTRRLPSSDLLRKRAPEAVQLWEQEWGIIDVRFAGQTGPGGKLDDVDHPSRVRASGSGSTARFPMTSWCTRPRSPTTPT
jgi:hypothetical protein